MDLHHYETILTTIGEVHNMARSILELEDSTLIRIWRSLESRLGDQEEYPQPEPKTTSRSKAEKEADLTEPRYEWRLVDRTVSLTKQQHEALVVELMMRPGWGSGGLLQNLQWIASESRWIPKPGSVFETLDSHPEPTAPPQDY
jgi:hypothetical protein